MADRQEIRKHFFVAGRVQGVGFRYRAYYLAQSLGLTGWVRNLYDGRVEMELQGAAEVIDKLFAELNQGSFIRIESCEAEEIPVIRESSFRVTG